ncbi:MAG: tRNA uridine(34) 5-carboxymethylaminomethyl modification radical SAM/GNAT enzyme Elp3 [Candidatus Micrarchaeota archaeon]|nr:tRNA uridine(34) 5-carboxymethylaminomethyl modification radical SAM/GNAT enzyme Elp3 [Candidatus Micrarchaeota archaeon]
MKKITRTLSGVTPVAVMMKPHPCPHGRCIYCPSINSPNSYTEKSPVVLRAKRNEYDPVKQIMGRHKVLEMCGHPTQKNEIIIMGGTFFGYPKDYRKKFVKSCFDALNGFVSASLEEAKKFNETAEKRCVGLCIETRPDMCGPNEINEALELGCTRIELGVQTLDNEVYKKVERGHSVKDVVKATQLLKDSAFKVYYHMMPGLFSDFERDVKMFRKLFSDADFRPDGLKIYPVVVVKGTKLEELYRNGEYEPYTTEEVVELLVKLKSLVPKYVRIARIMRDIPKEYIVAGTPHSHLRDEVKRRMNELGLKCRCIRCREVGFFVKKGGKIDEKAIDLCRLDYRASGGREIFLSYEDTENDVLISLLRLRIPFKPFRPEIDGETALIREMHTYGPQVPINKRSHGFQHRGYGSLLLKEAERIAKEEFGCRKTIVISGVGVRRYFYKHGYEPCGPYVCKIL